MVSKMKRLEEKNNKLLLKTEEILSENQTPVGCYPEEIISDEQNLVKIEVEIFSLLNDLFAVMRPSNFSACIHSKFITQFTASKTKNYFCVCSPFN